MGYYLYDADGYLDDAATIHGWKQFAHWAQRQRLPELSRFVAKGFSESPQQLAKELGQLRIKRNRHLEDLRRHLQRAAARAKDIIILTDGVGFEDEGDLPEED
jgi:hypothetical protein